MIYRYYSKLRPVSYGTYPKNNNLVCTSNFGDRKFCDDVKDWGWGYIEYFETFTNKEVSDYDLIDASKKWYYGVLVIINRETLDIKAKRYGDTFAHEKPENMEAHSKRNDKFVYYFDTEEIAEAFMNKYDGCTQAK